MKVVYFSTPHFLDYDLCLINELRKEVDLYYILDINYTSRKSNILEYYSPLGIAGIFSCKSYREHFPEIYSEYIDYGKSFFINRISKKSYYLSNIRLQITIQKFITQINPDIIHYNNPSGIGHYLPLLISKKIKKVLTLHDPIAHTGEKNRKSEYFKRLFIKYCDKVVLLNSHCKNEFSKTYNVDPNKIFVTSLGPYHIYMNFLDPNKKIKKIKNSVLFFGRISPYKGIEYLIEAAKIVRYKIPDLHVTIAGAGKFHFDISAIKNDSTFHIINRNIGNSELVELIQSHSLIVCPYTDATQSGVLMTVLPFNKKIIISDIKGINEIDRDLCNCILVRPQNVKKLAESIVAVLTEGLCKYTISSQETVNNLSYYWRKISSDICKFYETTSNYEK